MQELLAFSSALVYLDGAAGCTAVVVLRQHEYLLTTRRLQYFSLPIGVLSALGLVMGVWIPVLGVWIIKRTLQPGKYGGPWSTLRSDPLLVRTAVIILVADVAVIAIRLFELISSSHSPIAITGVGGGVAVLSGILWYRTRIKKPAHTPAKKMHQGTRSRRK